VLLCGTLLTPGHFHPTRTDRFKTPTPLDSAQAQHIVPKLPKIRKETIPACLYVVVPLACMSIDRSLYGMRICVTQRSLRLLTPGLPYRSPYTTAVTECPVKMISVEWRSRKHSIQENEKCRLTCAAKACPYAIHDGAWRAESCVALPKYLLAASNWAVA
jgi:hypothetical protein